MTDQLLLLKLIRPDGTTETRMARLPVTGACELRLRFHEGHFAKALLLRGVRLAAGTPTEAPEGHAVVEPLAAVPRNDH